VAMQTLGETAANDTRNHTITQQEFSNGLCESVRSLCSMHECRRRGPASGLAKQ